MLELYETVEQSTVGTFLCQTEVELLARVDVIELQFLGVFGTNVLEVGNTVCSGVEWDFYILALPQTIESAFSILAVPHRKK